jgi:hypothetical protein
MALSDCMSSLRRADSSARRRPQPSRIAIIATSRTWRKPLPIRFLKKQPSLILVEPVTRTASELLDAFDAPYACSKFRTQQTRVCRFVGQPSDRRKPLIDRSCG